MTVLLYLRVLSTVSPQKLETPCFYLKLSKNLYLLMCSDLKNNVLSALTKINLKKS